VEIQARTYYYGDRKPRSAAHGTTLKMWDFWVNHKLGYSGKKVIRKSRRKKEKKLERKL